MPVPRHWCLSMSQDLSDTEKYMIQRDAMKLVDSIVAVDAQRAVARSKISAGWPMQMDGYVHPVVLIELVAQTSGIQIRWSELEKDPASHSGGGFIVGIKDAEFFCVQIPLDAEIETCAVKAAKHMNYAEYEGTCTMNGQSLGRAFIQVLRTG